MVSSSGVRSASAWGALRAAYPLLERVGLAGVHVAGPAQIPSASARVVLLGNHTSWWDGFFHWRVAHRLAGARPHYTVMRESHLRTPGLRFLGGVGIASGTPTSVRRTVRALEALAAGGRPFSISLFPQGALWPPTRRPLGFRRGVAALLRPLLPCAVLPVAIVVGPGRRPRPEAWIQVGDPWTARSVHDVVARTESAVTTLLDSTLALLESRGEEWRAGWPPGDRPTTEPTPDGRLA